ncbi:signal recognition particle subunit [Actinomortierella ambigua]|uniref:Signal recognition particle subunit n=1 Tax=Actinomortierella ambigua TaxID=1343610 RepID=A0A9P6PVN1_9FUNG|nr:signal recognition particle subunit [Actinomortierella ambigua]
MSKGSSLHQLRQSTNNSFFLDESDDERNQHDDDFDVDNMDFPLPADEPAAPQQGSSSSSSSTDLSPETLEKIKALMGAGGATSNENVRYISGEEAEQFKSWMCVYPCYIDGTKTTKQGRRISKDKACKKQPWAKEIVEALKELRLTPVFEPGKTHPRDWENRGRVRVLFKDQGRYSHPTIRTKYDLLIRLAALINKMHANEKEPRAEFSPLSPLTPMSIAMPEMAGKDPLSSMFGAMGMGGGDENSSNSGGALEGSSSTHGAKPSPESKRQQKLAKKPKRVMIRG